MERRAGRPDGEMAVSIELHPLPIDWDAPCSQGARTKSLLVRAGAVANPPCHSCAQPGLLYAVMFARTDVHPGTQLVDALRDRLRLMGLTRFMSVRAAEPSRQQLLAASSNLTRRAIGREV